MFWIFLTILIPIVLSIYLVVKYKKEVVWFEHLWLYGYTGVLILIAFLITRFGLALYTEYYGSYVTEIRDYEYWNEYIHRTCTETYSCGTDSKGNTKYCTRTYNCDYIANHWQYYRAYTSTGEWFNLNDAEYTHVLKKLGGERRFKDMRRNYHRVDGDMYFTKFEPNNGDEYASATTSHLYENRIKASDLTVFNLREVTDEQFEKYGLHDYPKLRSQIFYPSVIGANLPRTNKELKEINGRYGKELQVRIFFWIYKNKPLRTGLYQEYYFVRGNKNEVHVCIGLDKSNNIDWVHSFTWSLTLRTAKIKQDILAMNKLNDVTLSNYVKTDFKNQLRSEFKRREFSQFDYIKIETPTWLIIVILILQLAGNGFLAYVTINNDIREY